MSFKGNIFRFLEVVFTSGALHSFLKDRPFSLAAYLQVNRISNHAIKPLTIIDIGANQGQFTLACLRHFPQAKIYSIEPNPSAFKILSSYTSNEPRITLLKKVISDVCGIKQLYIHEDSQASSFLKSGNGRKKFYSSDKIDQVFDVGVDTLDSVFSCESFDGGIYGSPSSKEQILAEQIAGSNLRLPALFLGDSKYDYFAAYSAGLDFIFVSLWTELPEWESFVQEQCLHSIPCINALLEYPF